MKALGKLTKRRIVAGLMALTTVFALLPPNASSWLRSSLSPLLAPLGDPGMYLALALRRQLSNLGTDIPVGDPAELVQEARYYKGMAAYWKLESERQQAQLDSVLGLADIFGPARALPAALVPARVVGEDALPYGRTSTVNVGATHQVRRGQLVVVHNRSKAVQALLGEKPSPLAVVTASALVGEVVESSAFTARVRLATDRGFQTPAHVFRLIDPRQPRTVTITTGQTASRQTLNASNNSLLPVMAHGDGEGGLVVEEAKAYDNILPGDLLITSGQSLLLPVGIPIGTVTDVRDDPGNPQRVRLKVRPIADLSAVREVLIVVPMGSGKGA